MTTLGTKLARLRSKKGYSQQEVADRLEVSQPAYHKWESDEAKPGIENIIKLSRFFEVDIEDLIDVATNDFSHSTFEGSNIVGNNYPVINMQSDELMKSIIKNQDEIAKLIATQNKLIEALLKK